MAKFRYEDPDFDVASEQGGVVEYHPEQPTPRSASEAVLRRHEARLMALPGVKGVGVGSGPAGEKCIEVYVASSSDAKRLPPELEGVCVTTRVVGEIDACRLR